ncbi:hypothetical protein, partial [Candidatus Ruminimicrobium bovinum]|uniref:hypothetical protein n=1 Tax=Candidatus Ruminimicrobium bovinum TaxID=3242779 RepID=UPI0039B8AE61
CQETKNSVNGILELFLQYATHCLESEEYVNAINALLPFDHFLQIKEKNLYDNSLVESMGLSNMRMDFEPSVFSLGACLEIAESKYNKAINTTIFVSAGKTLEEIKEYVKTEDFAKQVRKNFEKQVDMSFRCITTKDARL